MEEIFYHYHNQEEAGHTPWSNLEIWTLKKRDPRLSSTKKQKILFYPKQVKKIYPAIPAYLLQSDQNYLMHHVDEDFHYYFLVAELWHSNDLIFFHRVLANGEIRNNMLKQLKEKPSEVFLFDHYFLPFCGGIEPKYHTFVSTEQNEISLKMTLFRKVY